MSIYQVRVIPRAKRAVIKEENGRLKVYVTAPAIEGKANQRLKEALADYWGIRQTQIHIIKGLKSRDKTIKIMP